MYLDLDQFRSSTIPVGMAPVISCCGRWGYHPDYDFLRSMGIELLPDQCRPFAIRDAGEQCPGIYVAGVIVAGSRTTKSSLRTARFPRTANRCPSETDPDRLRRAAGYFSKYSFTTSPWRRMVVLIPFLAEAVALVLCFPTQPECRSERTIETSAPIRRRERAESFFPAITKSAGNYVFVLLNGAIRRRRILVAIFDSCANPGVP